MGLSSSQYQIIMRMYEKKQALSRDRLTQRYEEVYRKSPEFQSLDESISILAVQYGKRLLGGDDSAVTSLREELAILRDSKNALLKSLGFPENYLEPVYECTMCQDTGYIGNQKCQCFKRAASEILYEQSNLKERLSQENFDTFSLDYYSENFRDPKSGRSARAVMADALDVAKKYAGAFGNHDKNLFLYGDVGVGKTFLSNCIAKEVMDAGSSVLSFSAPTLFNIMAQNTFQKKEEDTENLYQFIFDCDLLIIDDLGTELTNSFVISQLFTCINERLFSKKSTIISTNLSLDTLADVYTERSFSRITSNYIMLKLIGDDIRIMKKLMNREEL